ncbi:GIY-YIG nuclease [Indivirus ILV1]|uniref:GIY-YIG nuclease n=1 Tax=Indivirus ILV1 TaxID=1977633 RepID=A0A1V0SE13_9VIRU|nr:GIY-YIG nuclease [Indivirus ILV1]
MPYYCYLLYSTKKKRTYIGITNNLQKRLKKHNSHKGAKSTHTAIDWFYHTIVGEFIDRGSAQSFEWHWKHIINYKKKCVKTKTGLINKMRRLVYLLIDSKWNNINIIIYTVR